MSGYAVGAHQVAFEAFELDDVGAEVAQYLRGQRPQTEVKSSTRTPASGPALFPGLIEGEAGAGADMGQVK